MADPPLAIHRTIEAVWRIESARIIAGLARRLRDVGLAEELAQDALVAALEQWPAAGIPDNPAAWLTATARHRAIGRLRHHALAQSAPSPVVELNRAVAVAMAYGPAAGLAIADRLLAEPALRGYHLLPSVRADLLARLNRMGEAHAEYERAAALARNRQERTLLLERAARCLSDD
ncbi:sigma factor [Ralstonia sp. SM1864_UCD524_TZ4]|uniref:RNA polymerase sigma-70 region 2 domain-containing protein n=1 Tax=Ralstonia solanacearum TaxID=305 RepID=A0A0S4XDM5_RALSL|nr:sigma factor [Ralstonia pseudosolanacearum]CUV21677.1 protein of unknown function [Ralstonia solanacearum]CUV32860.1 protein of unknown function [Ralstonia solanacearum]CUV38993.1 protein of unknown function [Ralstonia solanacearum]CUV61438.1 protein of unknown function [Ralstonia solanacearum]